MFSQRSTTRRSAGIPSMMIGILSAGSEITLEQAMTKLMEIGGTPVAESETDGCPLPQVHALNSLTAIFKTSYLSHIEKKLERYIPLCLQLAADCLKSEVFVYPFPLSSHRTDKSQMGHPQLRPDPFARLNGQPLRHEREQGHDGGRLGRKGEPPPLRPVPESRAGPAGPAEERPRHGPRAHHRRRRGRVPRARHRQARGAARRAAGRAADVHRRLPG
ncbi:hypothetical protein IMZ48_29205 [Candidatus Bathyarchaeota archaeon]|nr:hypothetical protein [Candidatus Bathyarchaeota archaeon]